MYLRLCFSLAVSIATGWSASQAAAQGSGMRENSGSAVYSAPNSPAAGVESSWRVLARSVEDRPIEYRQFGEGKTEALVVGPLEGDETAALTLIEQLADHLAHFPRSSGGVRVTIVRDPNPDGRLRRSPFNARGVQLNRNFATRNWHKLPSGSIWLSGREPESEAETRAIADLIGDLRPDRVIILATTRRNAELAYAGPAESLAREFAKSGGLRPVLFTSAAEPGSLASYAGEDRNLPTLVFRVPTAMRGDQLWSQYRRSLLAILGVEESDRASSPDTPSANAPLELTRTNAHLAAAKQPPPSQAGDQKRADVLRAEDLEFGGELVPIAPPAAPAKNGTTSIARASPSRPAKTPLRRQYGPVMLPGAAPAGPLFVKPGTAAAGNLGRSKSFAANAFPPGSLSAANQNTAPPSPTATFRPVPVARPNVVERLPRVDAASSPKQTLPQPIPFYPETGY